MAMAVDEIMPRMYVVVAVLYIRFVMSKLLMPGTNMFVFLFQYQPHSSVRCCFLTQFNISRSVCRFTNGPLI